MLTIEFMMFAIRTDPDRRGWARWPGWGGDGAMPVVIADNYAGEKFYLTT